MEYKWTYQTVEAVNEEDKKDGQFSERCTLFKTGFQGSLTEITEMLWMLFEGLQKKKNDHDSKTDIGHGFELYSCKEDKFTRHY